MASIIYLLKSGLTIQEVWVISFVAFTDRLYGVTLRVADTLTQISALLPWSDLQEAISHLREVLRPAPAQSAVGGDQTRAVCVKRALRGQLTWLPSGLQSRAHAALIVEPRVALAETAEVVAFGVGHALSKSQAFPPSFLPVEAAASLVVKQGVAQAGQGFYIAFSIVGALADVCARHFRLDPRLADILFVSVVVLVTEASG